MDDNRKTNGEMFVHPGRGLRGGDIISTSPDASQATKWVAEIFTSSENDTSARDAKAIVALLNSTRKA